MALLPFGLAFAASGACGGFRFCGFVVHLASDSLAIFRKSNLMRAKIKNQTPSLAGLAPLWHKANLPIACRRSSGVERALGKGEARSSILRGGTIFLEISA